MVRIVLDANQFISALLKPGSNPDAIMQLIREEKVILLLSETICSEILRVLTYPKILKCTDKSAKYLTGFVEKLKSVAIITPGTLPLAPLAADPDDTKYLVCALEGKADFIISCDHHLTDLRLFQGIRIVDAAAFLEMARDNFFGG
jgi:uncharacterized protein